MKLIAISHPKFFPDEAALLTSLFREGLACLHVRKPESSEYELQALLRRVDLEFLDRISIHQHHQLAEEFGIKRLHFPENQRKTTPEEMLRSLRDTGFTLSTSIHDSAEINLLSSCFSYTFFGPVFNSISKSGYKGALQEGFCLRNEPRKIQIIALGGIEITNINQVNAMNFDGAAVLGTLWNNPEKALENFKKLNKINHSQP